MKKSFILCFAVVCCILTSVVFTSCNKDDDDDNTEYVSYNQEPSGSMSWNKKMLNLEICEEMRQAVRASFGEDSRYYPRDDAKAIKACDKVAEKNRNEDAGNIVLVVSITSPEPGGALKTATVKTYTFPF